MTNNKVYLESLFAIELKSHILNHIDLEKAQLGLGNSYSRSNVKFNVNRVDNMVIQAISLLDTLDKDINTFCKRVRYCKFKLSFFFTFFGGFI